MVLVVLVLVMSGFVGPVQGQEDVLAGPKYHNLRTEEDFSYLGGEPGTFTDDMWAGEFIDRTGSNNDDPSLFYAQIEYKF